MYALSGIILTFRDTGFLKKAKRIENTIEPNLTPIELQEALNLKQLKVKNNRGEVIEFNEGKNEQYS
jgi:hypothetical protein